MKFMDYFIYLEDDQKMPFVSWLRYLQFPFLTGLKTVMYRPQIAYFFLWVFLATYSS